MKSFSETYFGLKSLELVNELRSDLAAAHGAVQKLEAGAQPTLVDTALASVHFLQFFGFYPNKIKAAATGESFDVATWSLCQSDDSGDFFVKADLKGNEHQPQYPVLGPAVDRGRIMLDLDRVMKIVERAFPEVVVFVTDGEAEDGSAIYHVTARTEGYSKVPLASGSAVCSNEVVAIMQALLRYTDVVLTRRQAELKMAPISWGKPSWAPGERQQAEDRLHRNRPLPWFTISNPDKEWNGDWVRKSMSDTADAIGLGVKAVDWAAVKKKMEEDLRVKKMELARKFITDFPAKLVPYNQTYHSMFDRVHLDQALDERLKEILKETPLHLRMGVIKNFGAYRTALTGYPSPSVPR